MSKQSTHSLVVGVALLLVLSGCGKTPNEPIGLPTDGHQQLTVSISGSLNRVIVQFSNAGPTPVYILKPLDGSIDGRGMPHYRFTVRDSDNQSLKLQGLCGEWGLWAETQWPRDYLIEIKPGATHREEIWLSGYYKVLRKGPHNVSFEYVYQPERERFDPPREAWRGAIKAPDVVLE